VRVVVADDSMLMRQGLALLLAEGGIDVVGTADNATILGDEVAARSPDAVIVDIRMPPTHTDEGIRVARELRASHATLGILVLSHYLESHYAATLLAEAPEHIGYLLKDRVTDVAVLVDALERVVRGECVIDPTIVSMLLRRPREPGPLDGLTEQEQAVLALVAEGRSNQAIAHRLFLSSKTVEAHIRHIMQKLDLAESPDDNRRVLAVLEFLRPDVGGGAY
jgi:DNA-binding NarL/FixJ family response regulator